MQQCISLLVLFIACLQLSCLGTGSTVQQRGEDRTRRVIMKLNANGAGIPMNVLARLQKVRSHADLAKHFRVNHALVSDDVDQLNSAGPEDEESPIKHMHDHSKLVPANGVNFNSFNVISDLPTSDSTCHLFHHCVSLPLEAKERVIYYPQCITLPQCMGGCCQTTDTCHATRSEPVRVNVTAYEWRPNEQEFQFMGSWLTTMEKHLECGCKQCSTTPPTCNANQQLFECECIDQENTGSIDTLDGR